MTTGGQPLRATAIAFALLCLPALLLVASAASAKGPALADLVVTKISKPPAAVAGGSTLKLAVKLRNKGTANAGKSKVAIYLAKGKVRARRAKPLKRAKVKPLAPGKKAKAKLRVVLPSTTAPGTYRLLACADDTAKVKESKERNCISSRSFGLNAGGPVPPAAPAFSMTDDIDWGLVTDKNLNPPDAGGPVTATLTAANGLPGQAGYVRTSVASEPLAGGAETNLDFSKPVDLVDDGSLEVPLPFPFPFGGVAETTAHVAVNGRIGFGSPVFDFWEHSQHSDYRGPKALLGTVERGIMPYWGDLDAGNEGSGAGTVKLFVPGDKSYIAFRWEVGQHGLSGVPRRLFQLVLYPDGRFRFDYPGGGAPGGNSTTIGYSLGTGPGSADLIATSVKEVPPTSFLFTPNPVAAGPIAAGETTVTLPGGSGFVSGSPGCALTKTPGTFTQGLVTCPVPALAPGQQTRNLVTYAMPPDAIGGVAPPNFKQLGSYIAGGLTLTDADEVNRLASALPATGAMMAVSWTGPAKPKLGTPGTFKIEFASGAVDEPVFTIGLPAGTTFNSAVLAGKPFDCDAPVGNTLTCRPPSGSDHATIVVSVTPTTVPIGSPMKMTASARGLNLTPADSAGESPPIVP